jgi:hypothetical protein
MVTRIRNTSSPKNQHLYGQKNVISLQAFSGKVIIAAERDDVLTREGMKK